VGRFCLSKMKSLSRIFLTWVKHTGNWAAHAIAKWAEVEPNKV